MPTLRTVLCPVDFSPATRRQVDVGVELSRAFHARLVLHHNLTQLSTAAAVGWMWAADHPISDQSTALRMHELVEHASAGGLTVDARITHGIAVSSVLALAEAIDADLLVLSTHANADSDDPSVTARVLQDCDRPMFVLHEAAADAETLRFTDTDRPQVVLATTDFSRESLPALTLAFALVRRLPIDLHLLHVQPAKASGSNGTQVLDRMAALVPDDLGRRVRLHVEAGAPSETIAAAAARLHAGCIVMGEHTRAPFRRWFSRDTSLGVLQQAPCPVWFVPGHSVEAAARTLASTV